MPGKFETPRSPGQTYPPRRRRRRRKPRLNPVLPGAAVLLLVLVLVLTQCFGKKDAQPVSTGGYSETATAPAETEPARVVATATVATMGDLLMHKPVINTCRQEDGSYDFTSLFQYITEYTCAYDYMVANLETTFGGPDYPYQGNPEFNCPDSLLDALTDGGFDMLLTANNHCSDTHTDGIKRTVEQVRGAGLTALGTQLSDEEDKYALVDINGIKIGMICYTYADSASDNRPVLNFREQVQEVGLVNYFTADNLLKMYAEAESMLTEMEAQGAEATMFFIHWGTEYELTENAAQNAIAQKLCDLGVDVIVGGHPHVVQPMELLESTTDPEHKTVCIYSLGNAVSNQRRIEMRLNTGHTEDGAVFSVTFEKYSDGAVYVAAADVLPIWVVMYGDRNNPTEYNILPLDKAREQQWLTDFGLSGENFVGCQDSYRRTMDIVSTGLTECRNYLAEAKAQREQPDTDLAA